MKDIKMHPDFIEYKNNEAEIKELLDTQYDMAIFNHDYAAAYENLGKMMEYKLIDTDDARIEKNNKTYIKGGIDKGHRFRKDYRKSTSFIPSWLYGELPYRHIVRTSTIEHWGKRVEGNYEGDTVFPSRPIEFEFSLCESTATVSNAFDGMAFIIKMQTGKKLDRTELEELCKAGVYRVYKIDVYGNCINSYRNAGYAIIRMGKTYECNLFVNYGSLIGNWVGIKQTTELFVNTIKAMLGAEDTKVKVILPMDKAIDEQRGKLNISNNTAVANKKLDSEQDDKNKK